MVNCDEVLLPPLLCRLMGRPPQQIRLAFREKLAGFLKERIPECRPTLTKKEVEAAEDLDLTGEPLDMGFDPNQEWNLSVSGEDGGLSGGSRGPRLKGLKLGEARVWLSKREEKERWALVEGGENLYLGNRVDSNQTMLSKVTWAPSSSLSSLSSQLDKVMERHNMAGGRGVVKTEASAVYSFSGGEAGHLQVEANWNRVSSILETPPLDCSVTLRVEVGEEEEGGELQLLEGFVRGLKGEGVTWVTGPESRMETMLSELLEEVRCTGPRSGFTRIERTGTEEGDETEQGSQAARQEEDFTDRLWSCLSHASSYAQLTEALSVVLTTISKEELRPYIYARNKTSVARMVQGLARGSDPPSLTGSLPLQMLVECGVEKLTRDASHRLVVGELATREAVQRLLGEKGEEVGLDVQRLGRLHRVVQVASLTQALLPLPLEHIRGIVQSALTKLEVQQCTSFSFPLASGVVTEQLGRSQTSSWQVRLMSGRVETVALYEVDMPEELMGLEGADRKGEDENHRAEYFSIFMSTIARPTMVPGAL